MSAKEQGTRHKIEATNKKSPVKTERVVRSEEQEIGELITGIKAPGLRLQILDSIFDKTNP